MEFKLVYGNHGKDPFHIMDTLLLVKLALESLGYKADLEAQMKKLAEILKDEGQLGEAVDLQDEVVDRKSVV